MVQVVAVAAAIEQVKEPPTLFNAQDQQPQKNDKAPKTQGSQEKPGQEKKPGKIDWATKTDRELFKSKRSYLKRINEHVTKLEQYIKDPYSLDHKKFLQNVSEELKNQVIANRIRLLRGEIEGFKQRIIEIIAELTKRGIQCA